MCTCKYCDKPYDPRPQVKNPQACKSSRCQTKRQRDNEKDWRKRNLKFYDRHYYASLKATRIRYLKQKAQELFKPFTTGLIFEGMSLDHSMLTQLWDLFFLKLGVRRINKLWMGFKSY
jgi:hypothetical protein